MNLLHLFPAVAFCWASASVFALILFRILARWNND